MEHASAPIKYRSITEVAKLPGPVPEQVASLPFTHRPALTLAMTQQPDGTWGHAMLTVPSARAEHFEGVGTINAVRRLLEYGWDKTRLRLHTRAACCSDFSPKTTIPTTCSSSVGKSAADEDMARRARAILREAAAAALAQAGYEGDPRLRGAARRIIERVAAYLRSPLAQKPFVRIGNQHVLPAEAAPPSVYVFAHARVHAAVPQRASRRRWRCSTTTSRSRCRARSRCSSAGRRSSRSRTSCSAICCPIATPPTPTSCSPSHGSSSWRDSAFSAETTIGASSTSVSSTIATPRACGIRTRD